MKRFDNVGFSMALKGKRKMRGLSLRQAATQINLSAATIGRIESGEDMEIQSAVAVAEWLELPLDAFIRREAAK